ncbi:MAG: DNA polymerase III subunit beta [Syntrophomonadaceae bacterium]|nr:DNA polymerase III subunit beta [Syntrophomonadaceae bacterium]
MKFTIAQPELAHIAALVQRAAASRDTVPALSGLLIQASIENGLTLTATDLEIAIRAKTDRVSVREGGTVLLNARYFSDLVRFLPETELQAATDEGSSRLVVTYGRSESHLNLYDHQEFPDLPLEKMRSLLSMPQSLLKEMLRKTAFAAAVSHFRQVFTGVLFDIEGSQLRVVASDTHRLALMSAQLEDGGYPPQQFVVPARTVNELTRLLEDSLEPIDISLADNSIVFHRPDGTLWLFSRLVEGQYPNYLPVIPQTFISTMTVDTRSLVNTLERASLLPTDKQAAKQGIRNVVLEIKEGELHLSSHSEKMGALAEVIEGTVVEGETGFQVAFNTRYFLDVMKILQTESPSTVLQFTGSLSPALVKNPGRDDFIYVIVPLVTT